MKTTFLFPGQGAQTIGKGADLYDYSNICKLTFDACRDGAKVISVRDAATLNALNSEVKL